MEKQPYERLEAMEKSFEFAREAVAKLRNGYVSAADFARLYPLQKLVEKEKPMKPNNDNCPNCGKHLGIDGVTIKSEYCPHCGQRIDWEEKK